MLSYVCSMDILTCTVYCGLTIHTHTHTNSVAVMLCIVGILFPIGFSAPQFGGQPYLLPKTFNVGYSYALFNLAVLFSVVGLLVANRLFLPSLVRTNR